MTTKPVELSAVRQQTATRCRPTSGSSRDAMEGDPLLFARADAVETMWTIANPLVAAATPVFEYEPGSWGPSEADRLAADIGGWQDPG